VRVALAGYGKLKMKTLKHMQSNASIQRTLLKKGVSALKMNSLFATAMTTKTF